VSDPDLHVRPLFEAIPRVDRTKYQIQIPLPPKIDASVTMMQVEEKPDVTYSDIGGCKEQIEKLREVVETPLLSVCQVFKSQH
jgi:ATP-dependent 26S proteasome regulatory subunit